MKPLENAKPNPALGDAQAQAAARKPALGHGADGQLYQRLWQLLLPLPEASEVSSASAAASSSASLTHSSGRERDERDRDASSQLTSAAYVLAGAVQQLGLTAYAQDSSSDDHPAPPSPGTTFNVRLSEVDANGGIASLEIAHPQLGDIALEVELSQGSVRVIASAPSEHCAQMLEAGQALLAQRLARQGIVLEALDIVVAARGRNGKQAGRPRAGTNRKRER